MDKAERTAMDERAVEALREVLSRTECRENGLRANMDEIASMAHQMIKIVQRGALRPDPNTGWLETPPPLAKPAPMSASGEMVNFCRRLRTVAGSIRRPGGTDSRTGKLLYEAASRLESLEALFAEQAGELERAESHAQMLLLAVEAGDPKPELAMRVKDLISALSDIRKARGKE